MKEKKLKQFTTLWISTDILKDLTELKVNFHWIEMTKNTDKINALILLYKENQK